MNLVLLLSYNKTNACYKIKNLNTLKQLLKSRSPQEMNIEEHLRMSAISAGNFISSLINLSTYQPSSPP